jgi:hypothetical protein
MKCVWLAVVLVGTLLVGALPASLAAPSGKFTIPVGEDPTAVAFTPDGAMSVISIQPNPPQALSLVAGDLQVGVSWQLPTTTGDLAITGYTVVSAPGNKRCSTTGASTFTVTGLTNDIRCYRDKLSGHQCI